MHGCSSGIRGLSGIPGRTPPEGRVAPANFASSRGVSECGWILFRRYFSYLVFHSARKKKEGNKLLEDYQESGTRTTSVHFLFFTCKKPVAMAVMGRCSDGVCFLRHHSEKTVHFEPRPW